MWDEMVKKAVNVRTKTSLQPLFGAKKIDSRCPQNYRLLVKKDKDDIYWKHCKEVSNKDKDKAKFHNSFSANQPQI